MRTARFTPFIPLVLALAVVTAACSKGNAGVSPLAPSTAPVAAAPAASGATISGVVVNGARTAALPATLGLASGGFASLASAGSYTITVNGTTISVGTNDDGSFVLQNVPPGDLTLTITGNGFSAQVVVPGVESNEQVRITVRVNGSTAELDDEDRVSDTRAEVEGRIVSVSGETIVVGSRLLSVIVPAGTPIRHGNTAKSFSDLVVGVRVHVKANRAGDVLTATEVKLQNDNSGSSDDEDDDEDEAEFSGAISTAISGACPVVSFTVDGKVVKTNESTKFDDVTCLTLAMGMTVKVEGTPQPDGSVLAKEVEVKGDSDDDDDEDDEDEEAEVSGAISGAISGSCPAVSFTVAGTLVRTNSSTKFDDVTCGTLASGDTVQVEGMKQPDGSILAEEVEKKSTTSSSGSGKGRN